MKSKIRNVIPFLSLFFILPAFAQNVDAGISIGPEGLKSFYFSISDYYHVPEKEVVVVRERKIPDEELPVVFFIAARAGVEPKVIVDLRLGGSSWYNISIKYGIYADVYYVPLVVDPGPPYGKAYGYYKKKPKKEWKKIKLADADIINLVNLRYISEYYDYKPENIVKMRSDGKNYVVISENVKVEKKGNKDKSKGKNKGNNKKNNWFFINLFPQEDSKINFEKI